MPLDRIAAGGTAQVACEGEALPHGERGAAPEPELPAAPAPPQRPRSAGERLNALVPIAIVGAAIVCIIVLLPGVWVLLGTLLLGLSISLLHGVSTRKLLTMLLCLTTAATAADYLAWRVEVTNWAGWVIAAPLLVAELFGALHVLGLQYTVWPRPAPSITPSEDPARRPIYIFIPTVNEGSAVLLPTIKAALAARRTYLRTYPYGRVTIVICNDGLVANASNWRETRALARQLKVRCVTRTVGGGAKAGNIEHARQHVGAIGNALLAIFDADQLARQDFLLQTVPPFADPSVGWVQSGQYYSNVEQPVARWAHDQQALFYRILCPGKAVHNAAFICGTNVVIRAAALDQIGGLPQDSVTEDFAASIQLHPTWRSIFLTDVLATGLGPMDLPAYLRQQRRWAIGTLGVLRTHWRAILLPRRHGLKLDQRIQYGLACTHYLCGLRDLIYIVSPIAFLVSGVPAVRGASLSLFLWHFLPYFLAAQGAFWYVSWGETGLRGIIIGFGSFPTLVRALLAVVRRRRSAFMVTSKQRRATRAWSHLVVYLVALLACLVGIGVGLALKRTREESIVISILWVLYDMVMLGSFLWLGVSDLRYNAAPLAVTQSIRAKLQALRGAIVWPETRWATRAITWPALVGFMVFVVPSSLATQPAQFRLLQGPGHDASLGLSLRVEALETAPLQFERQLCLPFSVIGRTQDIAEQFDFGWAEQLTAQHQRPWITLQFGAFGAGGKAPLDATLPAIANGVQDGALRRWAQAVHAYGQPIYLTVLLHVDRNWAVSSAVANGGIPQDVPRAWEHVQAIFRAAGDTNVAWVWAPADPAHDQPYAPPESTIDAVLQSMIRYPGSPWPDAAAVLQAVAARHPTKPLFVEVSGAGDPAEKAAWLQRVDMAVHAFPQVAVLFYHEGAPDLHASAADNTRWSLASDPLSLQAMHQWRTLVPAAQIPCGAARPGSIRSPASRSPSPIQTPVSAPVRRQHGQSDEESGF